MYQTHGEQCLHQSSALRLMPFFNYTKFPMAIPAKGVPSSEPLSCLFLSYAHPVVLKTTDISKD